MAGGGIFPTFGANFRRIIINLQGGIMENAKTNTRYLYHLCFLFAFVFPQTSDCQPSEKVGIPLPPGFVCYEEDESRAVTIDLHKIIKDSSLAEDALLSFWLPQSDYCQINFFGETKKRYLRDLDSVLSDGQVEMRQDGFLPPWDMNTPTITIYLGTEMLEFFLTSTPPSEIIAIGYSIAKTPEKRSFYYWQPPEYQKLLIPPIPDFVWREKQVPSIGKNISDILKSYLQDVNITVSYLDALPADFKILLYQDGKNKYLEECMALFPDSPVEMKRDFGFLMNHCGSKVLISHNGREDMEIGSLQFFLSSDEPAKIIAVVYIAEISSKAIPFYWQPPENHELFIPPFPNVTKEDTR